MAASHTDGPLRLQVSGIGAAVGLTLDGAGAPGLLDRLAHAWSRCLEQVSSPAPSAQLLVTLDPHEPLVTGNGRLGGTDPDTVMVLTTQAITRALIESQAGRLLMLHAGAVAHPETGRTVVLVAPGGTGKTTLVRTLAGRYGYLTDETVAIDADHRVLPYPKPLSVRRRKAPKQELSPDELGLLPAPAEPTVVRLCLLDRDDRHAGAPEIVPLDLLDAITELTPQTSSLYVLPEGLRTLARLIETTGPVLRLRYTEADDLLPTIDALLAGDDPQALLASPDTGGKVSQPASSHRGPGLDPGSPNDSTAADGGGSRLRGDNSGSAGDRGDDAKKGDAAGTGDAVAAAPGRRSRSGEGGTGDAPASSVRRQGSSPDLRVHANQFADLLERDGEALVLLRDGGLLRLSPLGASIVEFAVNPIRLDALADALERRFGAPEGTDLVESTAQRVRELATQGVLTLGEPPFPDAPGPFWRISDDTAYTVSAPDRVVVFNLATPTEQPQALIGTAATIWRFLLGNDDNPRPWTSEPGLIADLAEAYATDPDTVAPDVRAFLTRLRGTGHLQRTAEPE